jgi:predicted Zn-dependent peptidase
MEKHVILEEIGMYQDSPFWVAYEKALTEHFKGHPLERLVLGTNESITALTVEQMRAYHQTNYRAGNIVLAVAGKTDWSRVLDLAEKHCSDWAEGTLKRDIRPAHPQGGLSIIPQERSYQQHVLSLTPGPPVDTPFWPAPQLLSVIVGDSVNSRMYWDLVDPGHVDSASLWHHDYEGSGFYGTYLCCDPGSTEENLNRIRAIVDDVNRNGVTEAEVAQAKSKVASRLVLAGERPNGRLDALAENWIYRKHYRTVEDDLKAVEKLSVKDFRELLDAFPLGETTTVAVGPLTSLNGH